MTGDKLFICRGKMDQVGSDGFTSSVAEFVYSSLAQACRCARGQISPDTQMLDLDVDSLTLLSVLAQVEAAYGVELTPDDTVTIIGAASVSDVVGHISGVIARSR